MAKKGNSSLQIYGLTGTCGTRRVFLGFAPACTLYQLSFADVLDEATRRGYQRRFSKEHSLEFRHYIQKPDSATIPLTFNLRPSLPQNWSITDSKAGQARLSIVDVQVPVFAQVDCQHRLGHLADLEIPLPFMTFIGLSVEEEMQIFSVINGKAKGLNSSLLDFHESRLTSDLAHTKPELYIALRLNEEPDSPWCQRLDLGGDNTLGMTRYASLRMMQRAAKRFLKEAQLTTNSNASEVARVPVEFWQSVSDLLQEQWLTPRTSLITKGIGVYSLMSLCGELYLEARRKNIRCDKAYFLSAMSDFLGRVDWSSHGPLRGFGGTIGAEQALDYIRSVRKQNQLRLVQNG